MSVRLVVVTTLSCHWTAARLALFRTGRENDTSKRSLVERLNSLRLCVERLNSRSDCVLKGKTLAQTVCWKAKLSLRLCLSLAPLRSVDLLRKAQGLRMQLAKLDECRLNDSRSTDGSFDRHPLSRLAELKLCGDNRPILRAKPYKDMFKPYKSIVLQIFISPSFTKLDRQWAWSGCQFFYLCRSWKRKRIWFCSFVCLLEPVVTQDHEGTMIRCQGWTRLTISIGSKVQSSTYWNGMLHQLTVMLLCRSTGLWLYLPRLLSLWYEAAYGWSGHTDWMAAAKKKKINTKAAEDRI